WSAESSTAARASAAQPVLGHGALEEIGVDLLLDAPARAAVGGVALPLVGQQRRVVELGGELLRPGVGGGGIAGGADDQDRAGALGGDRRGLAHGLLGPLGTAVPAEHRAEGREILGE